MSYLKDFIIPFRGLTIGNHIYDWEIGKKFFETYDGSEIIDNNIYVSLDLEKQERMMILRFDIKGQLTVICDRCLDDLDHRIDLNEKLFIKFGSERKEESEDVLIIPESVYELDLGLLINEYITLALPMKKIHKNDKSGDSVCNPETIRKLEELQKKDSIDPRWDQLKNVKID